MKKGQIKLLLFEVVLIVCLLLNSFIGSILSIYAVPVLLFVSLVAFKFLFNFENYRSRYLKDILIEVGIILLIGFLLYYALGLLVGFAKTENYLSWYGLKIFILPLIARVIMQEYLRIQLLQKSEGSKILFCLTFILLVLIDLDVSINAASFKGAMVAFETVALKILPTITRGILATYIAKKSSYKINIMWLLVVDLYAYIIPIIPNPNEYLLSIIKLIYPLILFYRLFVMFNADMDEVIDRDYRKVNWVPIPFAVLIIGTLVYFSSGYFHYHAIAIGSGSMEPTIHTGDIVLIEKVDDDYVFKEGDVIAYSYSNVTIVHRIASIDNSGKEIIYKTKGDANDSVDHWKVTRDMIEGVVNIHIPYIGLPVVWMGNIK